MNGPIHNTDAPTNDYQRQSQAKYCQICQKVIKRHFERHKVLHFAKELKVKIYGCPVQDCGLRYNRICRFRNHIKTKHKDIEHRIHDFLKKGFLILFR
jgi:hypothetical protein